MITPICNIYESQLFCIRFDKMVVEEVLNIIGKFDVFLINRTQAFDGINCRLVDVLATHNSSWIEVFGFNAESIHDNIDLSSYKVGRQRAIGDGIPMTVWHDEIEDLALAQYILTGGQGDTEKKLLIIVGTQLHEESFLDLLRASMQCNKS